LELLLRVSSISLWFYVFRSMSVYDITVQGDPNFTISLASMWQTI